MISLKTISWILFIALILAAVVGLIKSSTVCPLIYTDGAGVPCPTYFGWPLEFRWPGVLVYPLPFIIDYLVFVLLTLIGFLVYQIARARK